ncbi:FAD:protein FMN transferase [Thalassobius sp. Cn5-15]|uniref:FAD:protein FMN transferase n=1 Tax=Thalassobius sp. Cn5-15 TaxID=2917763 RepID=UPI001EF30791|nr:FAD:protein FMN transferase [Thalassobius sp. Cn5-15]MCG7495223.1 FAD:protein FMN transferase [Thalassobius sp. Cn5-15]
MTPAVPPNPNVQHVNMPWCTTPTRWQGAALGTDVALKLDGPQLEAEAALQHTTMTLAAIQSLFDLYDPSSLLRQLNANGALHNPDRRFLDLCALSTQLHVATGGVFDPTIQPLWNALFQGHAPQQARQSIGWKHVDVAANTVTLETGQKLSFNGVAQGFATDMLTRCLRELGIQRAVIELGELAVIGGPAQITLSQPLPDGTHHITLNDSALSISHPDARLLRGHSHILHPKTMTKSAEWAWVAVEADRAAIADGASTAFVLMSLEAIEQAMGALEDIRRVWLVSSDQKVRILHR